MVDIYQAYQEYLNNIGEYVPSASDVYSGVAGLTSRVPQVARDVLLPSDDGDGGIGGGPGGGGTGGIGDLLDQYNNASFLEKGLVNTGIGLAFPQAAGLLGMYNVGKGIYDFGRDVFGYNDPFVNVIDFDKELAEDQRLGGETGLGSLGFSANEIANFDKNLRSEQASESNNSHGGANDPGNTSGGFGGDDDE